MGLAFWRKSDEKKRDRKRMKVNMENINPGNVESESLLFMRRIGGRLYRSKSKRKLLMPINWQINNKELKWN